MMSPGRFVIGVKCTTPVKDADNEGAWGKGWVDGIPLCLLLKFCCEPRTALKTNSGFLKR
jgi:hypothetical protein